MTLIAEIPLVGAGGEPVDFLRTIVSHGVAELPPNKVDLEGQALETTLAAPGGARTVRLTGTKKRLRVDVFAGSSTGKARDELMRKVAHMFRLNEDLSAFYVAIGADAELGWCATGAGRMLRAPTVFEDVVKTN